MNRVTEAIVNPAFMLGFLGAPLLTSVAGFLLRRDSWVIAGLVQNLAGPASLTCRSTARFAVAADRDVAKGSRGRPRPSSLFGLARLNRDIPHQLTSETSTS
jgi:hypothetical protein